MAELDWYFDFISPFAWLQWNVMNKLPGDAAVTHKPLLFAGLLNHWEHKGPAEIPAKRVFTYQHTLWCARRLGIPFRGPRKHPFNPLPFLRLAIAAECQPEAIERIFAHIWAESHDPTDTETFVRLGRDLGFEDPVAAVGRAEVKAALSANGHEAIERGVFGVPTFFVDNHLFWGFDATEMVTDYLADPEGFFDEEMSLAAQIPEAAQRLAR